MAGDSLTWPPGPLVSWPPGLLEFYFETLMVLVESEGVAQ